MLLGTNQFKRNLFPCNTAFPTFSIWASFANTKPELLKCIQLPIQPESPTFCDFISSQLQELLYLITMQRLFYPLPSDATAEQNTHLPDNLKESTWKERKRCAQKSMKSNKTTCQVDGFPLQIKEQERIKLLWHPYLQFVSQCSL